MGTTGVVCAQDFQKGVEAYNSGDYATALKQWKVLAEQGNAEAQFNLGVMYGKGEGVAQYYKDAVKWFHKAAEQGYAEAQGTLGGMYELGLGVTQDYKKAVKWWRKAAQQGFAEAQFYLGMTYVKGLGATQNLVTAHMWFSIAAANGAQEAAGVRELVANKLSSSDLAKAQRMAKRRMNSNYKDRD